VISILVICLYSIKISFEFKLSYCIKLRRVYSAFHISIGTQDLLTADSRCSLSRRGRCWRR